MELEELQKRHREEIEAFRQMSASGCGSAPTSQILMSSSPGISGKSSGALQNG